MEKKYAAAVIRDESNYSGAKKEYEPTGGDAVLYAGTAAPGAC
jgi:hypothetical protein